MYTLQEDTDLKQTAENILAAVIDLATKESNTTFGSMELAWERVRQKVAARCMPLVEQGLIDSFTLQEIDTGDIEGWSLSQGQGKIFTLYLEQKPRIAASEPRGMGYYI